MGNSGITRRKFMSGTVIAGAVAGTGLPSLTAMAVSADAVLRPRLYFSDRDIPALRERFLGDPLLRKARTELIEAARKTIGRELMPEEQAVAGKGQHGNYYAADAGAKAAIEDCAFAHLISGEEQFALQARKAMRHFAQYEAWTSRTFAKRDPPWHSALETAHFTRAFALGIDWLGSLMDAEERRSACEALARLGVEPIIRDWVDPQRRIHVLDSMGHNWWMVCVAAGALGAMSLLGHDRRAEDWLALSLQSLDEFFRYPGNLPLNKPRTFDPQGGFYEGLNYANYTLTYYAHLMTALRHMRPAALAGRPFDELAPQVQGMFEFMLYFLYPLRREAAAEQAESLTVGFGDDGRHTAFSPAVTLLLAQATGDGRYRWYFDRYTPRVSGPLEMLLYNPQRLPKAVEPGDLPLSRVLSGIGWASLRDSWKENATFLAIKCGHTWNHAHADAGSFIVYAGGEPLLIDSETCSYTRREYRSYYTESIAHNTVLVDGQGQPSADGRRGTKFPGRLLGFHDAPDARYVLADATGPMAHACARFLRHFLWLDGVIVLVDDLLAHKTATFEWLFHGETPPTFADGVLSVTSGAATLQLHCLFPTDLEATQRNGLAPHAPDRQLAYLALRQASPSESTKFLGVLQAGRTLVPIKIARREDGEWIGASIEAERWQWDIYCNLRGDGRRQHVNSNQQSDGWQTDAFLFGLRHGDAGKMLVIDGSYLRTPEGAVAFDCFSKCHAVLVRRADGRGLKEVYVQCAAESQVRIESEEMPRQIVVNGRRVAGETAVRRGKMLVFSSTFAAR